MHSVDQPNTSLLEIPIYIKSIVCWIKLDNTTGSILKLTDTPHSITVSSGTVATSGWPTTVTIYVIM
jgi:hypothetical protein